MSASIRASVGRWEKGAVNNFADVETVQTLLTEASKKLNDPSLNPNGIDGKIAKPPRSSGTVNAIEAFQRRFMSNPDGRIDVGGRTWNELVKAAGGAAAPPTQPVGDGSEFFPFSKLPGYSWTTGPRAFASNRSGGTRAHAGCDLYFPAGTIIHAVKAGTVIRGPYYFYADTYALEVNHGDFVVRYGEVQKSAFVKPGDKVTGGQKIARVGHLKGISVPSDMLHFEIYRGTHSGELTVRGSSAAKRSDGVSFQRRKDLMDPTPFLNRWKSNLAPA